MPHKNIERNGEEMESVWKRYIPTRRGRWAERRVETGDEVRELD